MLRLLLCVALIATSAANAGTIAADDRLALKDYAAARKLDAANLRQKYGASGRIQCPSGEASAFLVYKKNIVVTARHVLYPEKEMHSYAGKISIRRCAFEVSDGVTSTWYKVDVSSFRYPQENQRSVTDRYDWVVMKLNYPLPNVVPYQLPDKYPPTNSGVTMVTIRQDGFPHDDWNERVLADCKIRNIRYIDQKPFSGLQTDCSATTGASGAALVRDGANGVEVVGIQSSVTRSCSGFDDQYCYSFAVGMYEDIKNAIRTMGDED
jgi:V8-like Glu-specific endopeptidase